MKLHEIFKQPVDRPLKGVIIADDNDTLEQEIKDLKQERSDYYNVS